MILFWKFFCLVVVWFFVASLANATYPLFVVLSEAFETVFQSMDSDQDRGIDEGEFVAYFGVQSAPAEQPPEQSQEAEQPEEGQAEQGKGSAGEQLLLAPPLPRLNTSAQCGRAGSLGCGCAGREWRAR